MKRVSKPLSYEEAFALCSALCSRCEQCSYDLIRKMEGRWVSQSDAQRVMERLRKLRFVDDARYARAYAHDKLLFSGWGRKKILQGLYAKRISREDMEQAFDNIEPEEYESVAKRVIDSRVRLSPELLESYESRLKLLRFAMQRGFEAKLAVKIINELKSGE